MPCYLYGRVGVLLNRSRNVKLNIESACVRMQKCLKNRVSAVSGHIWGSGSLEDGVLFVNTIL